MQTGRAPTLVEKLGYEIATNAIKHGDFTLASGKKSSYYLDCKKVTLDSKGARLVGRVLYRQIADHGLSIVGGMSIGADPIVASVLCAADEFGQEFRGFMVRKEPKKHGTKQFIEGLYVSDKPRDPEDKTRTRVAIVEDVVTTGGSAMFATEKCLEAGFIVEHVFALVDRLEGGREAFAKIGVRLHSVFTIRDFGIEPPEASDG